MKHWAKTIAGCASGAQPPLPREPATQVMGCGWSRPSACCTMPATCHGLTHMRSATMTYVYAGAADWGGKDPAQCNRGPYRSTDAGDTWERMHFPGDEPVVWSFEIHPADARVMYVGTQDMAVYRSEDGRGHWRRLTVPTNPDGLCVMGFPTRMIRLAIDPTHPDELYAGVAVGALVRSLDGGATWTDCNAPLLELATQERYTQKHGPRRASEGMMDTHALAISAAQPGTVFLANRLGLFRSDDKGER